MSGQTLNDLIATVFMRASEPPSPPPPRQFDRRAPESSTSSSSFSTATSPDPAEQTLSLLARAQQLSDSIGVVSLNDTLRDISTSSLRTLFLSSLQAHLHSAVRTGTDHAARRQTLARSQSAAASFLNRVMPLGVVPPSTKQLLAWSWASLPPNELADLGLEQVKGANGNANAAPHAREVKIAMFKLEHALKSNLEQFRSAYQAKKRLVGVKAPADVFYDLLLYPQQQPQEGGRTGGEGEEDSEGEEQEDDEDDLRNETSSSSAPGGIGSIRQYLLALLNLHVLRSAQLISSSSQELQLLRSMPSPPPPSSTTPESGADAEWRLDRTRSSLPTSGPLMAPSGKVLRPFTITNQSRAELASQVFRPDYRLPTMSIDEYLEEEQRRGNFIQGGGHASYDAPTSTEQRQTRMEQDGTRDAQLAEDEQRQKDIQWDQFSELNPRGAGNTMNRG